MSNSNINMDDDRNYIGTKDGSSIHNINDNDNGCNTSTIHDNTETTNINDDSNSNTKDGYNNHNVGNRDDTVTTTNNNIDDRNSSSDNDPNVPRRMRRRRPRRPKKRLPKDVFVYIITSGIKYYYKVGYNTMALADFKRRYHSYIGEFNFVKYSISCEDFEEARDIAQAIEEEFLEKHDEHRTFSKYEMLEKKDENKKDLLPVYKKSLAILIRKHLNIEVSAYIIQIFHHFVIIYLNYVLEY